MKTIVTLLLLSLAAVGRAEQPKITETAEGITVEYTGTASDTGDGSPSPLLAAQTAAQSRQDILSGRIEQLQQEIAELANVSGSESDAEQAQKRALADQKRAQVEALRAELARITDKTGQNAAGMVSPHDDQPNQQTRRQEMKKELREMRQLRRDSMTAP